ncbi:hypothetical protein IFM89_018320 [Coptis chinensis]|uniref:F-box protein n=1 Tax=Coptis chinensis TaxID=261450 RepID=A0A835LBA1_9MAGN|nr:hypothetical protein IFM89_018320 [Coptis chinensis]
MANWSEIPDDIIQLFVKKLSSLEDFISFSLVCNSWRSVATAESQSGLLIFSPWLMLTKRNTNSDDGQGGSIRTIVSLSTRKLINIRLLETQGRRCWGSACGWLVTMGLDLNIHLLNPLSRIQISLPSLCAFPPDQQHAFCKPEKLCQVFVEKFALGAKPPLPNQTSVVMAIYGGYGRLAFATPGDEAWTPVESSTFRTHEDIIFFNGHFYVVTSCGYLRVCEINMTIPRTTDIAPCPSNVKGSYKFYLMEISGILHLIVRNLHVNLHYFSVDFEVYKFDFCEKFWCDVLDLGDHALFVGNNNSFSISTSKYPEFKANCIYFTDDHGGFFHEHFYDMGVYNYNTGNMEEPFYSSEDLLSKISRPIFFMPSL